MFATAQTLCPGLSHPLDLIVRVAAKFAWATSIKPWPQVEWRNEAAAVETYLRGQAADAGAHG